MYKLESNIRIGKWKFKCNDVRIKKSLNNYVDTCVIKLPTSARLTLKNQPTTASVQTAKQFNYGDKVTVQLGYNGKLEDEFEGFVSRINFTTPLEVECEGYAWQLRHKSVEGSYQKITLKNLLKELIVGTDIVLSDEIDDMPIENLTIPKQPVLGVFDYLKEHCFVSIFFRKNVLFAGLAFSKQGKDVKHKLGWNVIKDNDLKLRRSGEVNVKINLRSEKIDGTKARGNAGAEGGKVINRLTVVQDEAWLKKMAEKKLQQYVFDGYEGKITTFLIPHTIAGDTSILSSQQYIDQDGKYAVESSEVIFSLQGARRVLDLGLKVS